MLTRLAALPLFLIPRTWAEAWVLWAGTFLALVGHASGGPYASQVAWVRAAGVWLVLCAYLPCLVMILRRPNVATASMKRHQKSHAPNVRTLNSAQQNR